MTSANLVGCRRKPKRLRSLLCTGDHCARPCAAFVGRQREDRHICVAARERVEGDLAIPDDSKLAAQKTWRGTVLRGRRDGVDDPDASVQYGEEYHAAIGRSGPLWRWPQRGVRHYRVSLQGFGATQHVRQRTAILTCECSIFWQLLFEAQPVD